MKAYVAGKQKKEFYPAAMKGPREAPRYGFYERAAVVQQNAAAIQELNVCQPASRADYFRLFD